MYPLFLPCCIKWISKTKSSHMSYKICTSDKATCKTPSLGHQFIRVSFKIRAASLLSALQLVIVSEITAMDSWMMNLK